VKRYDGQIAVVTGASSGIGRRLALDLAARGATVIGVARRKDLLDDVAEELRATSPTSEVAPCDVADTEEYRNVLRSTEARFGCVDVLINNAGTEQPTPATDPDIAFDVYRHMMDVNYFGAVTGTLTVLRGMLERGHGVIANMSSDVARAPEPRESAYAASKAALSAYSESVAHEVADRGVRVHVVYPGWVPTAMGTSGMRPHDPLPPKLVRRSEQQVSEHVLDRLGDERIEINCAWLPLLAPIGRTLAPKLYQRGVRRATRVR